jgi:hypothetical protein
MVVICFVVEREKKEGRRVRRAYTFGKLAGEAKVTGGFHLIEGLAYFLHSASQPDISTGQLQLGENGGTPSPYGWDEVCG